VLVPDIDAKAEGRGVWVTASAAMVAEAQKRKAFARALKTAVTVPDDLAGLARRHMEQRLLGALGLARKAGQIVTGATRVAETLRKGEAIALITASDAAEDGRNKMAGLLRGLQNGVTIPHFEFTASSQLGLALGLENVVHAALTNGAAAQSALARAERLARFIAPKDSV
jgi:ribosomal protein L7Ae-like RNA K-turn-binding protein